MKNIVITIVYVILVLLIYLFFNFNIYIVCLTFLYLLLIFKKKKRKIIKKIDKKYLISFEEISKMDIKDKKLILLYLQTTNNKIVLKDKFEKWLKKVSKDMYNKIK